MPNHVETKMWLIKPDGSELTDAEVEAFFTQFITLGKSRDDQEPRFIDFGKLVPPPKNIWLGYVGGSKERNMKTIEEFGGIENVLKAMKAGEDFPDEKRPCLTNEQIKGFGLVNGLDWNVENWETKWGAYDCRFEWGARYGGDGYAQVYFYTAWAVPEKILRLIRKKAVESGYDIIAEFGGELDDPGEYSEGTFMYWNAEWDEEGELVRKEGLVRVALIVTENIQRLRSTGKSTEKLRGSSASVVEVCG